VRALFDRFGIALAARPLGLGWAAAFGNILAEKLFVI